MLPGVSLAVHRCDLAGFGRSCSHCFHEAQARASRYRSRPTSLSMVMSNSRGEVRIWHAQRNEPINDAGLCIERLLGGNVLAGGERTRSGI